MMEQIYGVVIVPLIMGVVAMIKDVIPKGFHKYMGMAAWGLGLLIAFAYGQYENWGVLQRILVGSAVGLSAAGFYSTQKNARE